MIRRGGWGGEHCLSIISQQQCPGDDGLSIISQQQCPGDDGLSIISQQQCPGDGGLYIISQQQCPGDDGLSIISHKPGPGEVMLNLYNLTQGLPNRSKPPNRLLFCRSGMGWPSATSLNTRRARRGCPLHCLDPVMFRTEGCPLHISGDFHCCYLYHLSRYKVQERLAGGWPLHHPHHIGQERLVLTPITAR